MRIFSFFTTCLIALSLAGCGGGGGSPGLSSGSVSAFQLNAPPSLTLQVGVSQQYSIQGGVKPYSVFSSNPAVALGWFSDENLLSVGAVAAGTATITAIDNKGSKFDIAVTAGSSTALFTSAPGALTIAPGPATSRSFDVRGGSAPYTAVSSDTSVATVVLNGSSLTITGVRVGSATISISDSAGGTLSSNVTVATVPLTLNPTSAQAFVGDVVVSKITGGTPPYRASVGIPDAVAATITNGNELTMTYLRLASPVIVTVLDANDQTITFTANVILGTNRFRISPDTLTISEQAVSGVTLTVIGAAPGTINVFSSNQNLLTASVTGNRITVSPSGRCVSTDEAVTISAIDSKGAIGTATITVKDTGNGSPPAQVGPPPVAAGNCPL